MIKVFYSVNASLYITSGRTALLIDGIHNGLTCGFSAMPEGMQEQLENGKGMFARLDGLLFTHLHPDHYDEEALDRVLEKRPRLALWGPRLKSRGVQDYRMIPGGCGFRIGDFRIFAYVSIHSGEPFREESHRSFLIRNEVTGEQIFIGGDAVFSPELADTVTKNAGGPGAVDGAFIMIYQLMEKPSKEFLTRLAPKRLLLYHRPLEEDDRYVYLTMIRRVLDKDPLPGRAIEQPGHMEWVEISK